MWHDTGHEENNFSKVVRSTLSSNLHLKVANYVKHKQYNDGKLKVYRKVEIWNEHLVLVLFVRVWFHCCVRMGGWMIDLVWFPTLPPRTKNSRNLHCPAGMTVGHIIYFIGKFRGKQANKGWNMKCNEYVICTSSRKKTRAKTTQKNGDSRKGLKTGPEGAKAE